MLVNRSFVSLKTVLLGDAAIPIELTEQTREQGIRYFCGYGLTELASTVCAKGADGLADVGLPLSSREVKIANNEAWLWAASMVEGYWRNGQLVSLVNNEGWYTTRGRGEMHNSRLTTIGRLDNLFLSGDEDTQPEGVERVVAAYSAVLQVLIIPVADKEFDRRPVAVMECDHESVDLSEWVKDKLTSFQQSVRWLALPPELRNGGIKISRQALREWMQRQQ